MLLSSIFVWSHCWPSRFWYTQATALPERGETNAVISTMLVDRSFELGMLSVPKWIGDRRHCASTFGAIIGADRSIESSVIVVRANRVIAYPQTVKFAVKQ